MTVLVTGGAGYIGAHVVQALRARAEQVIVVDDCSTGRPERVTGVELARIDLVAPGSDDRLRRLLVDREVDEVVHLAARKRVDESVADPVGYYRDNVGGLVTLLAAMQAEGVRRLVFSSSAAVYGAVDVPLVDEDHPVRPVNPYGETKLIGEWLVRSASIDGRLAASCLRYFNVAGAGSVDLRDGPATNLIPLTLDHLRSGRRPVVFGTDYDTPDGTCVRDFVHVSDIADAHTAVLDGLRAGSAGPVYNVGSGRGFSVREVIHELAIATGVRAEPEELPRRRGDPPVVVADTARIEADLGWRPSLGLRAIVASLVP